MRVGGLADECNRLDPPPLRKANLFADSREILRAVSSLGVAAAPLVAETRFANCFRSAPTHGGPLPRKGCALACVELGENLAVVAQVLA